MVLRSFASLAAALFAATAHAQTFSPDRIKADISFLADDLLEGRGTGTRGYDVAALYVAQRFAALGLKPGNGTSWFQPIPFLATRMAPDRPSSITINGKRFANLEHVIVGPGVTGEHEVGSAPVVFVGYGLEEKSLGLDDYRGVDVRGKIVAMLWGKPSNLPNEVGAALQREKSDLAAAKGAVGILMIRTPVQDTVQKWEATVENSRVVRMRWIHPDGRIEDPTATAKWSASLDPAATDALFEGTLYANGGLRAAIADTTLRPKAMALPARVSVERYSLIERAQSANVIGIIPGSDPSVAGELIILSAHLDHLGIKSTPQGDTIYNGAMDNAAGIATMLETARAFAESPRKPRRSVAFVALTGEEKGLLGSQYLAQYRLPAKLKPVANVNLDMPILTYDFRDVIAFGAEHSTLSESVARAATRMGLRITPDPIPEQNLFTRSDHYNWVKKGVPSIFLKTGIEGSGRESDTSFRGDHYHKVSDDLALPFVWSAGAKFARINYLIARELADAPEAPRWYVGDFFGNQFAPQAPKAVKR